MQKHTTRVIVASILVAAGIAGGFFVFSAHHKADALLSANDDLAARLTRLIATTGDIASAQQAYVAPGQPREPWLERNTSLLQRITDDFAAVRPRLRAPEAPRLADETDRTLRALADIDGKARADLLDGQDLLAADLLFSEGRDTASSVISAVEDLSRAERVASDALHASLDAQQGLAIGLVALLWVVGLIALVPAAPVHETRAVVGTMDLVPIAEAHDDEVPPMPVMPSVDLTAAADVCASLARVADARSLPGVLERAASVLDARGIIVWMGAGEELFPALAFGYGDRAIERMGPIGRNAANATADAWRSGEMRTVAGQGASPGAVAAPLSSVNGCMGVFAAELRHGREADPSIRAIAAIIAAQLASIVSAWPGASGVSPSLSDSDAITASRGA